MGRCFEHWVCSWAWCNCIQFALASMTGSRLLPDLKHLNLTPAQAANAAALESAMLWFSAAGAVAALLTGCLFKVRGGVRRALAGVGVACAVAVHCGYTWLLGATVVAAPSDEFLSMSVVSAVLFVFYAAGDVFAALTILPRTSSSTWRAG